MGNDTRLGAGVVQAYKTPMLMATATPIFSFLLIWSFQINFHGRRASVMSMAAE